MASSHLSIEMESDDAALIRLLGVIRRRGFAVRSMEASERGGAMGVGVWIESDRPVEILVRQIERIVGVVRVVSGSGSGAGSGASPEVKAGGRSAAVA